MSVAWKPDRGISVWYLREDQEQISRCILKGSAETQRFTTGGSSSLQVSN